jgi:glycosyltransferase involved in cell wall biosynthesis
MNISVVINTYNAEKHLRQVLQSVKEFDEILICDMESTDSTLDIAREFGCKIVTFAKENNISAEPARTFAIQSASCEWVLVIDADELVTPQLREYLYQCIKNENCSKGLFLPRKNFFMGKFSHANYPDYQLRFFIREGTTWPPYVHTFPIVKGKIEKIPKDKKYAIIHLADDSIRTILQKTNLYSENEIDKKNAKGYGTAALFYRPTFRFFKSYILKGGFRDGIEGLICACYEGIYQFAIVCKILEEKRKK